MRTDPKSGLSVLCEHPIASIQCRLRLQASLKNEDKLLLV